MDDISIVIKVVLSTASKERVRIFELLITHKGTLTTSQIVDSLNITAPTAKRTMAEFKALGLVTIDAITSNHGGEDEYEITLKPEFDWFLTEIFAELNYDRKKITLHLDEKNTIQNCILNVGARGGIFSFGGIYSQLVLHNSVLPRTLK